MWVFLSARLRRWLLTAVVIPAALAGWRALSRRRAERKGVTADAAPQARKSLSRSRRG